MRDNLTIQAQQLFERLAAIEHERWADWQRYVFSKCIPHNYTEGRNGRLEDFLTGCLVIPRHLVEQWQRQIDTPYDDLTDNEKESDREQVDRYWDLIE